MTALLSVIVALLTSVAVVLYFIDFFVFRKGKVNVPVRLQRFLANFMTFAFFFFAYSLMEL